MSPNAKVILDSLSPEGVRLTTMEVTFHRFVLAEFNTHRVFSRNSASSRAIPAEKMIDRVKNNPAFPVEWPSEQKGMQGGELLDLPSFGAAHEVWSQARTAAVEAAERLTKIGLHKSVTNRLLEPFLWHTVIVTSTEWDNFFSQRCSPLAQPEIRQAAELMREVFEASTPASVRHGYWHTPYIQDDEREWPVERQCMVSAARCARVSYLTHDGVRDYSADLELFSKLIHARPGHWSPLEHVATPADNHRWYARGNFKGWAQLRHEFEPRGQQIEDVDQS